METHNDKDLFDLRVKLYNKIIDDYESRKNYQKDIAEKYNIPVDVIAQALKLRGFKRGRLKTHENIKDGEKLKLMITSADLEFLDPYLSENTMKNN